MTDLRLFAVPEPVVPAEEPEKLSADARRTQRNRVSLANGRHPATGRALLDPEWGYRCRDCVHAFPTGWDKRTYWKCDRHRLGASRSAASDIRVSWPACALLRLDGEAA